MQVVLLCEMTHEKVNSLESNWFLIESAELFMMDEWEPVPTSDRLGKKVFVVVIRLKLNRVIEFIEVCK